MTDTQESPGSDQENPETLARAHHFHNRISWGAIFAGTILAAALQIMFTLLGFWSGLASMDPISAGNPGEEFSIVAGLWSGIGAIASLAAGGWVAAHLANRPSGPDGALHGITVWALTAFLSLWLMNSAVGKVLSTTTSALGNVLQAAGQGIEAIVPDNLPSINIPKTAFPDFSEVSASDIRNTTTEFLRTVDVSEKEVEQYLNKSEKQLDESVARAAKNPEQAYEALTNSLTDIARRTKNLARRNLDKDDAVETLVSYTGVSEDRARTIVNEWGPYLQENLPDFAERSIKKVKKEAKQLEKTVRNQADETAKAAADALQGLLGWTFLGMLLGLAGAATGGVLGSPGREDAIQES